MSLVLIGSVICQSELFFSPFYILGTHCCHSVPALAAVGHQPSALRDMRELQQGVRARSQPAAMGLGEAALGLHLCHGAEGKLGCTCTAVLH